MTQNLHILYTHNLRGDEAALTGLLPRLYSFLRKLKSELDGSVYLLDMGNSCLPELWPCSQTGGRSTLLVLDAMGYHAANAAHLPPDQRERLEGNHLQVALVDAAHPWENADLYLTLAADAAPTSADKLHISLTPAQATTLEGQHLTLAALEQKQIGHVQIAHGALHEWRVLPLSPSTPADPTIAGAVDFVLSEVRYHEKRSQNGQVRPSG